MSKPPKSALSRAGSLLKLATSLAGAELLKRAKNSDKSGDLAAVRLRQIGALVKELGHLKGAAMKLGQMLALEAGDYLPEEVVQVLEQLQNKVSFMPIEAVTEQLRKELGPAATQLTELSNEPVAAASIGQVHKARFRDTWVAVKIQYPGIRESIHSDMRLLGGGLKGLVALTGRDLSLEGMLEEFAEVFVQETDFKQEALYAADYRAAAAGVGEIVVPRVHPEVSSGKVLTLDFESGSTLTQWMREDSPSESERKRMGELILDLYSREFCEWGLVQTDPNPGNFLVRPGTHELVLLDFGATKRYSLEFRKQYSHLVMAIFKKDPKQVREISLAMGLISPKEASSAFQAFEALVFESMRPLTLELFDFNDTEYVSNVRTLSRALVKELRHSPPPKDLIFLHRKLGGVFQILRKLEVRIRLGGYIERFERLANL